MHKWKFIIIIIDYKNYIGTINGNCKFYNVLKRKGEKPGMCCNTGGTKLDTLLQTPEQSLSLLEGDHPEHDHFINRTRKYNGCFQMASFGAKHVC